VLDLLLFNPKTTPDFFWDARGGALPSGATFTRGSSGWYFNSAGVLTQAGLNVARFDYDPSTFTPLGYLAEPQSTNAITASQRFTDASWSAVQNLAVTDNAQTSPDGTINAATLKEDGTTNVHAIQWATLNVSNANVYGLSIFAKNISGSRWLQLNLGGGQSVNFNPSTGAIGNTNGSGVSNAVSQQLANGWWRFSVFFTATATVGSSYRLYLVTAGNSGNAPSYAGDGTSTIAVFGAQADTAGAGVTSYIPTAGSAVTRSADLLSLPLVSLPGWNANAGGVVRAIYRLYTNTLSTEQDPVYFWDGGANTIDCRAQSGTQSGSTASGLLMRSTSIQINTAANISPMPTAFLRRKQAFGWGVSRGQIAIDGVMSSTQSGSFALPVGLTTLYIGGKAGNSLNGTLERIAYYAGARSDAFVQGVTQ
jgi:hypothetical protein